MDADDERLIRFRGIFDVPDVVAQCTVSLRFHRWDPTSLQVDFLWHGDEAERRDAMHALLRHRKSHVRIVAVDADQPSVELLGISGVHSNYREGFANVVAIQLGIADEILPVDATFDVTVRLQPSGILSQTSIQTLSPTGEIQIEIIEGGTAGFETPLGTFEACETYEYGSAREHGNEITKRIHRASLLGKVIVRKGQSLHTTHEKMLREIDDACTALSLCYRQVVSYYEIEYRGASNELLMRRRSASTRVRQRGEELINLRGLVDGGLARLLNAIRASPESQAVSRAIQFLAASYEMDLEAAYFMAFSAMETVLNACLGEGEVNVVGASNWKKIESRLREALDDAGRALGLELSSMKDKLPELRRVSLALRVERACSLLEPRTADLWPHSTFADGLKAAADVRNGLFHALHSDDSMYAALVRVRTIAERLLLKHLHWPDDQIWVWSDEDLGWIK